MLLQQLVNGLTLGAVYTLIALSFSLVMGILGVLNLAIAELFMLGGYFGFASIMAGLPLPVALLAGMGGAGLVAIVIEKIGYQPFRDAPLVTPMLSTLGFSIILQNIATNFWGSRAITGAIDTVDAEIAAAILLRAVEPLEGLNLMYGYRKTTRVLDLTRGPGRLAAAFQIYRRHDGLDLCAPGSLWLGETSHPIGPIGKTVRIGITRAADQLLRFYERGNPFVSGPKRFLLPVTPRKKSSFGGHLI